MAGLIFFWQGTPCVEYTDLVEPIGLEYADVAPSALIEFKDRAGQTALVAFANVAPVPVGVYEDRLGSLTFYEKRLDRPPC